jgi:hypothetical protein
MRAGYTASVKMCQYYEKESSDPFIVRKVKLAKLFNKAVCLNWI